MDCRNIADRSFQQPKSSKTEIEPDKTQYRIEGLKDEKVFPSAFYIASLPASPSSPQGRRNSQYWNAIVRSTLDCTCEETIMEVKQLRMQRNPLTAAGIVLGLGIGGLFDGIFLHQILQWHHMLSNIRPTTTVAEMKINMVWDGFFDAATWILTLLGVLLLWRAGEQKDVLWSGKIFFGALLLGIGLFDFFEGLIDHQILGIHHVKPGANELIWDIGFLALGAILAVVGWILIKSEEKVMGNG